MDFEPSTIAETISILASEKPGIYYSSPKPGPLDDKILVLTEAYVQMNADQREALRGSIGFNTCDVLIAFAQRAAALAVRQKSERWLFAGLMALAIEDQRADFRDTLTACSLLRHSAKKIRIDPNALFVRAAEHAEADTARMLRDFHTYAMSTLFGSGMRTIRTPEGFDYAWNYNTFTECAIRVLAWIIVKVSDLFRRS